MIFEYMNNNQLIKDKYSMELYLLSKWYVLLYFYLRLERCYASPPEGGDNAEWHRLRPPLKNRKTERSKKTDVRTYKQPSSAAVLGGSPLLFRENEVRGKLCPVQLAYSMSIRTIQSLKGSIWQEVIFIQQLNRYQWKSSHIFSLEYPSPG